MENPFTTEAETQKMPTAFKVLLIVLTVGYGLGLIMFGLMGVNFETVMILMDTMADQAPIYQQAIEVYEKIGANGILWQCLPIALHLVGVIMMLCHQYYGFLVYVFGSFSSFLVGFFVLGGGIGFGSVMLTLSWLFVLHYFFIRVTLRRKF